MTGIDCLLHLHQELDRYSEDELHYISRPGVWSLGQMYDHILLVAHEYLDEVEACASCTTRSAAGKTPYGEELFRQAAFPPVKIRLPDEMNAPPNNTDSADQLRHRLCSTGRTNGKTGRHDLIRLIQPRKRNTVGSVG